MTNFKYYACKNNKINMILKFKNLDIFIINFIQKFWKITIKVSLKWNKIILIIDNIIINIKIIHENKNNFKVITDWSINKVNDNFYLKLIKKLLIILNNKLDIPLSIKMWKSINAFNNKNIFISSLDENIDNISVNILNLLIFSDHIYTNNISWLNKILIKLNIVIPNINNFNELYKLNDFDKDIVLINFWDYIEWDKYINSILGRIYNKFNNIFVLPNSTNFINKYSLSLSDYGGLYFLWLYNYNNKEKIYNNVLFFLNQILKISESFSLWELITKKVVSIEFKKIIDLEKFILDFRKRIWELNKNFLFEIILEIEDGYIDIIDNINIIDYLCLRKYENISNITMFISLKISNLFLWYKKIHNKNNCKKITYLSAPLSHINEFTKKTIEEIKKSKYIYWESISWIERFFKNLNITYDDKIIFNWEDVKLIKKYIKDNNLSYEKNKVELVNKVFPELIKLLDNSNNLYYISDWWVPCILDPGDYIKKYINLNYQEYSVIWIKWPNVISTVLLSCIFDYQYIYWAPLIYTIYPAKDYLNEIIFFKKENFLDTLFIFYSFWENINNDIEILLGLFWKNIRIQIIWDIWSNNEFNRLYKLDSILEKDIIYILYNLENIVYLLKN